MFNKDPEEIKKSQLKMNNAEGDVRQPCRCRVVAQVVQRAEMTRITPECVLPRVVQARLKHIQSAFPVAPGGRHGLQISAPRCPMPPRIDSEGICSE